MTTTAPLFQPYTLGPHTLKNRMVMAPMTRCRAGEGRVPTALNARYYEQRAGAGLIVTEGTQIAPEGIGYLGTPGIHTEAQVAGWRLVTEAVHRAGGLIYAQLWHVGRASHESFQPGHKAPIAPSAIAIGQGHVHTAEGSKPYPVPRALETHEIPGIVEQFVHAARCAKAAGFDGIELHGANGYLIDQFLRDGTNRRSDAYGGTVENRARFLLEIVDAVSTVWDTAQVGVRISPRGTFNDMQDSNPKALFGHVARELSARKLGYLHVVEAVAGMMMVPGESLAPHLRECFRGTMMLNGGYAEGSAGEAIGSGLGDLVSFGVPFLANPDLPARFAKRAPLNPPDMATFYSPGEKGYTDYPAL